MKFFIEFRRSGEFEGKAVYDQDAFGPDGELPFDGTYRLAGTTLTMEIDGKADSIEYQIDGDRLVLTYSIGVSRGKVKRREVHEYVREEIAKGAEPAAGVEKETVAVSPEDAKRLIGCWRSPPQGFGIPPPGYGDEDLQFIMEFKPNGEMEVELLFRPESLSHGSAYRAQLHSQGQDVEVSLLEARGVRWIPFYFNDDHLILTFIPTDRASPRQVLEFVRTGKGAN